MGVSIAVQKACQILRHKVRLKSWAGADDKDRAYVREEVRIYVESWIVPILDAIETGNTKELQWIVQHESVRRFDAIGSTFNDGVKQP